jgi:hypothetical protein
MASATAPSPGNSLARSLLNDAVLPPGAVLVHPGRTVVCQCAGVPADATYLITMHRYYVVAGTPAAAEKFLATHIPKGGVGGGEGTSYSNNGPEVLSTSTAFPANGPHVYLRQLGYSMTAKSSTSSWLRVDSQVVWVPSRTSAQKVTGAVSATVTAYKSVGLFGSSGGTKIHVSGNKLATLLRTFNSLPLGPQNSCMEDITGFGLTVTLKSGSTFQVYNSFCGGPSDTVFTQAGNLSGSPRYVLADTSCSLIKDVVSLFGKVAIPGTRSALHSCEQWVKHPVS